jgi:hypothetical protein
MDHNTFVAIFGGGGRSKSSGPPEVLEDGNTLAWYDAAESYMTKNGAELVEQWSDRSGKDLHLSQSTEGARPVWSADGVLFDGIADFMQTDTVPNEIQPIMLYAVLKAVSWANGDRIIDGKTTTGWCYQSGSSPNIVSSFGTASGANSDLTVGAFHILRILCHGAASKLQVNEETAVEWNCGPGSFNGVTLCRRGANAVSWGNIQFKEIIIRKSVAGESDIYSYLKNRYSL